MGLNYTQGVEFSCSKIEKGDYGKIYEISYINSHILYSIGSHFLFQFLSKNHRLEKFNSYFSALIDNDTSIDYINEKFESEVEIDKNLCIYFKVTDIKAGKVLEIENVSDEYEEIGASLYENVTVGKFNLFF